MNILHTSDDTLHNRLLSSSGTFSYQYEYHNNNNNTTDDDGKKSAHPIIEVQKPHLFNARLVLYFK